MKVNRHVKKILIAIAVMLAALLVIAIGYIIYVVASYDRISDNLPLAVRNKTENTIALGQEYEILTYNIGFGAYIPEFSFFMDSGVMKNGKKVSGKYGKGISKDKVRDNTAHIVGQLNNLEYDFVFAQEVDEDGNRSYHINQYEMICNAMNEYENVFAKNFHSAYLYYPFNDPHGKNDSGILTLSKYHIESATRRSFPVATDLSKFFDLDRCFSVSRLNVADRQLVLVNLHMSAYDEGGKIRALQFEMLKDFLEDEAEKGNYVIAGGDFNHDICASAGTFESEEQKPKWVAELRSDDLPKGYNVAVANNADSVPTCRSSDMPYQKGVNYIVIIDGFIVSDNIEVVSVENQNTEFIYSDHNPVHMKFKLKEVKNAWSNMRNEFRGARTYSAYGR